MSQYLNHAQMYANTTLHGTIKTIDVGRYSKDQTHLLPVLLFSRQVGGITLI